MIYEKRGRWVYEADGQRRKFMTEEEAKDFAGVVANTIEPEVIVPLEDENGD
jgi:hypothetical protein